MSDTGVKLGIFNCFYQEVLSYWRVKLFNIKLNKYTIPFVGNILEPIDNIWCIAFCLSIWCINFLWRSINIFYNNFSNFPEFTLSWVYQATFRVDIEVFFMVFYCCVGWFVYIIFSWESIWNSKHRFLPGWWFSLFVQH